MLQNKPKERYNQPSSIAHEAPILDISGCSCPRSVAFRKDEKFSSQSSVLPKCWAVTGPPCLVCPFIKPFPTYSVDSWPFKSGGEKQVQS